VRRRAEGSPETEQRIRSALLEVGPLLHLDPACVQLVRFDGASGSAVLRVEGSCPDCGLSPTMLVEGIAAHLRSRVGELKAIHIDGSDDTK
jgi:Fe-S cluster biogenesis protein NfuA